MINEEYKRRMSLEEDFMNYATDDLLYGMMYHLATYNPNTNELYLSKQTYEKHRQDFYFYCDINTKTLKRHLDKLIARGLIKDKDENNEPLKMLVNGKMELVFTFPYDKKGHYRLVNNDMLWYLVSTRNKQAIRTYLYLYNGFLWKQNGYESFVFTNKSILKALGYTGTDSRLASSGITNILESFQREGVIDYHIVYIQGSDDRGNTFPMPQMVLDFIATNKEEFKTRTF